MIQIKRIQALSIRNSYLTGASTSAQHFNCIKFSIHLKFALFRTCILNVKRNLRSFWREKKNRDGSKDEEKFSLFANEQETCWLVIGFLCTSSFLGSFPSTLGGEVWGFDFGAREKVTFLDTAEAFWEESLMTSSKWRNFTFAVLTARCFLEAHEPISWFTLHGEVGTCLDWQGSQSQSLGIIVVIIPMQ